MELSDAVALCLKAEGYQVDACYNGEDAAFYLAGSTYDAIILDRMLPGMDGSTILKRIRAKKIVTPVIMATALGELQDRIEGLDDGADDYIIKPYAVEELAARIRALLRRPRVIERLDEIVLGNLRLNLSELKLLSLQESTTLSKKETALLEYFFKNPNQVLSRNQILNRIWGSDAFVEDGNVDTYIHFIRRRIKSVNGNVIIKSVHGVGYRLEIEDHYVS